MLASTVISISKSFMYIGEKLEIDKILTQFMPHNNYEGFFLLYSFGVETKSHTSQTLVEKVDLRHLIKLFISRLTFKGNFGFWSAAQTQNNKAKIT